MVDLRRVVRIGEIIQPDPDRGGRRARVDEQRPLNADSRYRLRQADALAASYRGLGCRLQR
jgi:hypothetical protein